VIKRILQALMVKLTIILVKVTTKTSQAYLIYCMCSGARNTGVFLT
jgi:hypothetical protein